MRWNALRARDVEIKFVSPKMCSLLGGIPLFPAKRYVSKVPVQIPLALGLVVSFGISTFSETRRACKRLASQLMVRELSAHFAPLCARAGMQTPGRKLQSISSVVFTPAQAMLWFACLLPRKPLVRSGPCDKVFFWNIAVRPAAS